MNDRAPITLDDIERRLVLEYGEKRYQWHRQLVTLCGGGLTLLVSFQSSYISENASYLLLMQICWAALAIAICSGVLALIGAAQTPLDVAVSLSNSRKEHGDSHVVQKLNETNGISARERIFYQIAERLLVASFLIALVSLAVFAILNVAPS
jgi:ABC-type transport system involved in multi-copper enzyme maturation permease subunit